ncbi:hypothetical protein FACS1894152_2440 [Bacilli bacterium]|nr:hypothetical protein FACS1894152_2440 [Bacilli bacterium]
MHIPRQVKRVSANAFLSEKLPANIENLDLSVSKITEFGNKCFEGAQFTNDLILPMSVNSLQPDCF